MCWNKARSLLQCTLPNTSRLLLTLLIFLQDRLVSRISRRSIDLLKVHFKDSLERDDWRLVVKLKKMFGID